MNTKFENVIKKENYINQMWNDIQTMFGNEKHSYLVIQMYDIYDDSIYNRIENGSLFWYQTALDVYNDIDFVELLNCIDKNIPIKIAYAESLPHLRQVPNYVRVTYEEKKYYIYKIKNSTEFKNLVRDRYCLSYIKKSQTEYGDKLAKLFGKIVEPITTNK